MICPNLSLNDLGVERLGGLFERHDLRLRELLYLPRVDRYGAFDLAHQLTSIRV